MSGRPSTPRDVIAAFGGPTSLSERLHCRPSAVSNWNREGIPKSRWPDLVELARERRIRGITIATLRQIAETHAQRRASIP